jgi:hypothetical protein
MTWAKIVVIAAITFFLAFYKDLMRAIKSNTVSEMQGQDATKAAQAAQDTTKEVARHEEISSISDDKLDSELHELRRIAADK